MYSFGMSEYSTPSLCCAKNIIHHKSGSEATASGLQIIVGEASLLSSQ
jgi:hypothetical protein